MKVVLGTLKDKGEDLATFLEPRVGAKPTVSSDALEFEDDGIRKGVRPRHVKTYVKRFLYQNGVRQKYRVFVAGSELTVQEIVTGEKKEEEEKAPKEPESPAEESAPAEPEAPAGEEAPAEEDTPKKKAAPKKARPKKKKSEPEA